NPRWCKSKIGRSHREIIVQRNPFMMGCIAMTEFGLPVPPDALSKSVARRQRSLFFATVSSV
ncbi:MAG: hypothetical protein WCT28_04375, partial [Patescibacteria group bacterium]